MDDGNAVLPPTAPTAPLAPPNATLHRPRCGPPWLLAAEVASDHRVAVLGRPREEGGWASMVGNRILLDGARAQ
eukprot:1151399-Lingulodinium_polyedra.AAC.1